MSCTFLPIYFYKTIKILVVIFVLSIMSTPPTFSKKNNPSEAEEKIIAVVLNQSGSFGKAESIWMKNAIEHASDKMRAYLNEHNMKINYFDDEGSVPGAIKAAKLIQNLAAVKIVIFGYSSKTAIPLAQNLIGRNMISSFASSKQVLSNKELHVKLLLDNESQGNLLAQFSLMNLKKKNPCLIVEADDGFSQAIEVGFEKYLNQNELKFFKRVSYLSTSESEMIVALNQCYADHADVIVHSGRSVSAKTILNYHLKNNPSIPIVGSDGWGDFKIILSGKNRSLLEQNNTPIYVAYYWNTVPSTQEQSNFLLEMKKKYGEPVGSFSAINYDAFILAVSFLISNESSIVSFLRKKSKPLISPILLSDFHKKIPYLQKIYCLHPNASLSLHPSFGHEL